MPRPKLDATDILHISPLEEALLLIFFPDNELYSVQIERILHQVTGRKRHFGALQPILRDLEKRGLLSARWGDEAPEDRGGPRRRYYKIEGLGEKALEAAEAHRQRLKTWRSWVLAPEGG